MNLQHGQYTNITGTGLVSPATSTGVLLGFYVNNTTSGTLVLRDGGSGGTQITGTITPAIGWHFLPVGFGLSGGLHATIANSLDVTFIWRPA